MGKGDAPQSPGEVPTPEYEIRLRAASLDSSVYRSQFRMPRKDLTKEWTLSETIPEAKPFESAQNIESAINGANSMHGSKDETVIPSNDVSIEPVPPPNAPPPLAPPPPPLASTPPMSVPPPPPLRWRSASLDSRVRRPRIRMTAKELTLAESGDETPSKPQQDSTQQQWGKEPLFIDEVVTVGPSSNSPLPSFPSIAPPPNIEDIRARSASLDSKIFQRGKRTQTIKSTFLQIDS